MSHNVEPDTDSTNSRRAGDAPEFTEAVNLLTPRVDDIQRALSTKTRIRKWNSGGAHPTTVAHGNGAAVSFNGTDETAGGGRGVWSVQVVLIGENLDIEVTAPRQEYPGFGSGKLVARGRVQDLSNFGHLLDEAREPLSMIMRGGRTLRANVIRHAASLPEGSPVKAALLDALTASDVDSVDQIVELLYEAAKLAQADKFAQIVRLVRGISPRWRRDPGVATIMTNLPSLADDASYEEVDGEQVLDEIRRGLAYLAKNFHVKVHDV